MTCIYKRLGAIKEDTAVTHDATHNDHVVQMRRWHFYVTEMGNEIIVRKCGREVKEERKRCNQTPRKSKKGYTLEQLMFERVAFRFCERIISNVTETSYTSSIIFTLESKTHTMLHYFAILYETRMEVHRSQRMVLEKGRYIRVFPIGDIQV